MNKWLIIGVFLIAIGYTAYLYQHTDGQPIQKRNRLEEKYQPSDEFFLQRAFPDAAFDLKAYTKALDDVKEGADSRSYFENFDREWTIEGPGNLGARINTVAYHPDNTDIILAGYSSGGIFKTADGGVTWKPVFDDQLFLAIGSIVFDPTNPEIVYAGTGDPNISGFPFIGDGLYKSTDAGETWTHIGLEATRIISKVLVNPKNSNILYVASMGLPFEPNRDKGLYKSIDAGKTWQQILFLSEETGIIDIVLDTKDPDIIYAAGWDRIRNSKFSKTFGKGAKVHRSYDGGKTWGQLRHILPQDEQSRIGLATSQDAVFALYVDTLHNFQGLYRSFDRGDTWARLPTDASVESTLAGFGWYFGQVRVNPTNREDISILGVTTYRTINGGFKWSVLSENAGIEPHVDHHDLVFHPSGKMLLATDGGLYESEDNGNDWKDIEDIPASQTYRVAFNPHQPDYYYGGFQDNGTAGGNAQKITNWLKMRGGDGFKTIFHPTEPDIIYVEKQRGRIEVSTDGGLSWKNATTGIGFDDVKGWDMPYIMSAEDPAILYAGTHRVYKNEGGVIPNWIPISEDLTDGPVHERPQSIAAISESPINTDILYAGTMDANVWRSMDKGDTWEAIHSNLPERSVTDVVAAPDAENTVFVTYSGYKDNDFTPHIFRSDDNGDTWYSIAGDLPPLAINALEVLQGYDGQVLFAATDGGVYGTLNGGSQWERLGTNMPVVAAYDLVWNTGINTLIVGTFARSILSYSLEGIVDLPNNTISSTADLSLSNKNLAIFPNPVANELNLAFTQSLSYQTVLVSIFDIDGRPVQTFKSIVGQQALIQKEVSTLEAGMYILKIQGEDFYKTGKFVKQ